MVAVAVVIVIIIVVEIVVVVVVLLLLLLLLVLVLVIVVLVNQGPGKVVAKRGVLGGPDLHQAPSPIAFIRVSMLRTLPLPPAVVSLILLLLLLH